MSEQAKAVEAVLQISMHVDCPKCDFYIDLLDESDTNGHDHDSESYLLKQMFPTNGSHEDFECDEVVCTQCKHKFNVKGLEW